MQELKINVESEVVKDAFQTFILNYKSNIADFINQIVGNEGNPVDSEVKLEGDTITVYHIAPDKGFVLGETPGAKEPFQLTHYNDVAVDARYLLLENGKLSLFLKFPHGQVDMRLGAFKSIADAITGWDSEPVKAKLAEAEQWKKAKEKELKRMQKLGKAPSNIEDAQVVE